MRRCSQFLLALLTFLAFPTVGSAGNITYNIVNYPDFQNGWTLSGTITTDGTTGFIIEKNIKSWMFTITKGDSTFTVSNTTANASITRLGNLKATATELLLPMPPASGGVNEFGLGVVIPDANVIVSWIQQINLGGDDISRYDGTASKGVDQGWNVNPNTTTGLGSKANWVIATVPEPSTFFLAGVGVVCVVIGARTWRRQSR
jgi:hypothetical protein